MILCLHRPKETFSYTQALNDKNILFEHHRHHLIITFESIQLSKGLKSLAEPYQHITLWHFMCAMGHRDVRQHYRTLKL